MIDRIDQIIRQPMKPVKAKAAVGVPACLCRSKVLRLVFQPVDRSEAAAVKLAYLAERELAYSSGWVVQLLDAGARESRWVTR